MGWIHHPKGTTELNGYQPDGSRRAYPSHLALDSIQSMNKEGELDSVASGIGLLFVPLVDVFADIKAAVGLLGRNTLDGIGPGHSGKSEMG